MFTKHFSGQLAPYIDGELVQRKVQQAELHVGRCARCRAECEQVGYGMAVLEHLPLVEAPEGAWAAIEAAFQQSRSRTTATTGRWRLAFGATVVLVLGLKATCRLWRWRVLRAQRCVKDSALVVQPCT